MDSKMVLEYDKMEGSFKFEGNLAEGQQGILVFVKNNKRIYSPLELMLLQNMRIFHIQIFHIFESVKLFLMNLIIIQKWS